MNPQCMEAHYNRAVIMKADENYAEALHSFEQALLVNPTFPQVPLAIPPISACTSTDC